MILRPNGRQVHPDYFSIQTLQAVRIEEPEVDPDDQLIEAEAAEEELLMELTAHPDVIEAGAVVADAEAAVIAAEDAGMTDEVAMRRLDQARAAERAVLVRLQKARTVTHTVRSDQNEARRGPDSAFGEVAA